MNYFSLETRELSIGKRAGFFLKEGFFKGQKRGRAEDKCDLPLCVDWTGLVSQSSSSCRVDASISIQNHLLSFQLNENPQWHFRDKMSRCIFIFRRKWITTHPFCKKKKRAMAVHTETVSDTSEAERTNSPVNELWPQFFLFSPEKTQQ